MKKIIVLFITLTSLLFAEQPDYKAYLLGDENGNIYYSENIDEKLPLASVTKMMTLLLTFDALDAGSIRLNDEVGFPKEVTDIKGSRIWMKENDPFSVSDLIKASAIYSANNATQGLAYYISNGNIDLFVEKMNKKLKELNLQDMIEYYTPTGLPPYMTGRKMDVGNARGLYYLSIFAEKNKEYIDIASMKQAKIKTGLIKNRNKLLGNMGIYGIKTGHHDTAGYNICIVANGNDTKLFVVVLGGKDENTRDALVLAKLKQFNDEYQSRVILDENVPLSKVRVLAGNKTYIELYPDKNLKKILRKDAKINIKIKKRHFVTAPVKENYELGSYEVYINEKLETSGKLYSKEKISIYNPF